MLLSRSTLTRWVGNIGGVEALEEVIRHGEGLAALAFHLADNRVGTRVDNALLAGDVILEDEEDIAVRQAVHVFGLARIDLFASVHLFARC